MDGDHRGLAELGGNVNDAHVPKVLQPYFDVCFILGFGICSACGCEQPFTSNHAQFSDGWWLDEARAMHDAGWSVPEAGEAYCGSCSKHRNSAIPGEG
jgi:hypothetical protein